MQPPPCLLGFGLLFWGWQAGFPLLGALLAAVLESARWIKARWEFSEQDFHRIWLFCSLLLLSAAVYAFNANNAMSDVRGFFDNPAYFLRRGGAAASARTLAALLSWLPMIYFLFILAQAYSTSQAIPLEAVSYFSRRRRKQAVKRGLPPPPLRMVNAAYPYFGLCLFSASYHASEDATFFWGLALVLAWALWPRRSPKFAWPLWAGAMVAAVAVGYFGQRGLAGLQRYIVNLNAGWFSSAGRAGFAAARSHTELGTIGEIKGSGAIVIRLEPKGSRVAPPLLREASYRFYQNKTWTSGIHESDFGWLAYERNLSNDTTWVLLPDKTNTAAVRIACYLSGGKGLLPLPTGVARLENLVAFELRINSLGAVLERGPGLVVFDALYGPGRTVDAPPGTNELRDVAPREVNALQQVIAELHLRGRTLDETMAALRTFFQRKFTYGYWDKRDGIQTKWDKRHAVKSEETPLSRFLLKTRRGHCEYFATATTLLLRELGFDARYAVGYAVHEPARRGYVVRQRDAHAWCLVWRDGAWEDFDTTPASWIDAEGRRASIFQPLSDLWSGLWFEVSKFFWGQSRLRGYILWALAVVLVLLLYQIIFRARRQRRRRDAGPAHPVAWPGLDSEFYQLEVLFARRGVVRRAGETLSHWLRRAATDPALAERRSGLQELLRLHYRYRFDPLGLDAAEREALRRQAHECLAGLGRG